VGHSHNHFAFNQGSLVGGEMHIDDIESLVRETMSFHSEEHGNSPFDLDEYPNSPGLIYWVQELKSSFRVHTMACHDLAEAKEHMYQDEDFTRGHSKSEMSIHFFETDYYELAEVIQDQVELKRFPKNEEYFYNLSDPGLSWWVKVDDDSLELYFKKSYFKEDDGFIKLGPLADPQVASLRMGRSLSLFNESFPVSLFTCDDNKLQIKVTSADHPNFIKFKRALIEGNLIQLESLGFDRLDSSMGMFLRELVATRAFWMQLEEKLDQ
jgi:hypothetical protein